MHTPRGLLATLGVTLSMVAAAACVLFFTSTLVAVNGWPGLSDPPESDPVALAPVERALTPGGGDEAAREAPVVLGAPAPAAAPTAPVGLGPAPVGGTGAGAGAGPAAPAQGGGFQDGADTPTTVPIGAQGTPDIPSPLVPPVPETIPAVQPPATTPAVIPALAPAEPSTPTDRRVTVSYPVTEQGDSATTRDETLPR